MLVYESSARIDADPAVVWDVLTDPTWYVDGDNGVVRLEGELREGAKLKIFSELDPKRAFPAEVSDVRPNEAMTWGHAMPFGLFSGVRTFRLTPSSDGGTDFHMREEFSGRMLKPISKRMPDLQPSFDQFASGLRAEAERRAA